MTRHSALLRSCEKNCRTHDIDIMERMWNLQIRIPAMMASASPLSTTWRNLSSYGSRHAVTRGAVVQFIVPSTQPHRRSRCGWVDGGYFTGVRIGAPLFLIRKTTNFAGCVVLALRPTV